MNSRHFPWCHRAARHLRCQPCQCTWSLISMAPCFWPVSVLFVSSAAPHSLSWKWPPWTSILKTSSNLKIAYHFQNSCHPHQYYIHPSHLTLADLFHHLLVTLELRLWNLLDRCWNYELVGCLSIETVSVSLCALFSVKCLRSFLKDSFSKKIKFIKI